jgi:hypothetical protein
MDLIKYFGGEHNTYLANLPEEKARRILSKSLAYKNGVHVSSPIMCMGCKKCPFINKCPIPERDINGALVLGEESDYPVGRECIMETLFVEQKLVDYITYLNVDPNNPVEMSIVNELSLIDLYKNRCLLVLSNGDKKGEGRDFLITDVVAFNENGEKAENTKLHPVIDMIDKLERRRERWLEKLVETRESKAKMLAKIQENNNNSRVLEEISMLRQALYDTDSKKLLPKEILIDEE